MQGNIATHPTTVAAAEEAEAEAEEGWLRTGQSSTLTMFGKREKSFSTCRPLQG
jgi:hypothetical protein